MDAQSYRSSERLGPSFVCFLIWTFVNIARPQDYLTFLAVLRPALLICVITVIVMFFERIEMPTGMFKRPEVRLILLFYLIMLAGIPFAVHKGVVFRFITTLMPATIVYFLVCVIQLRSLKRFQLTAAVIVLSIFFSSSFYMIEVVTYQGFRAAASGMYDPNDIAMVFVTFLPLCLYVLLAGHGWKSRLLAILAACFATAGIMMSRSRGGVLALTVVVIAFLLRGAPGIRAIAKMAVVVVLAFIFTNYFSAVEGRFQNIGNDYNINEENGRINIWKQNLVLITQNPILGTGAGSSPIALGLYRAQIGGTQAWQVSHSSVFQFAMENGIPAFILYVILNIVAIANVRRIRRDRGHPLSVIAFFTELCFYGFWVGGLLLSHAYSVNLFLLIGFSVALRHLYEQGLSAETQQITQ